MTPGYLPDILFIDDERINNIICQKVTKAIIPEADIKTFTDPEEGLRHIAAAYGDTGARKAVLFLDINMPSLSGWQVLDRFSTLSEEIKKKVTIYMLSSSINVSDKEKAAANRYVAGFITKPLSEAALRAALPDYFSAQQP